MPEKIRLGVVINARVERSAILMSHAGKPFAAFNIGSIWNWEHWRGGQLIDQWTERNLVTDEGLTHVLDVAFSDATQITDWYIAVFSNDHTPAAGNTYAVPGYTEATAYTGDRQGWVEAGVTSKSITNSASKASLPFTGSVTIYGGALVGGGSAAATKADTAGGGVLFCVSQFTSGSKAMENGDVLKVTVTITAQDV
jgi:hypothetical protein